MDDPFTFKTGLGRKHNTIHYIVIYMGGGGINQETVFSQPTGPWRFKAYVLDGGGNGTWDHGRFSGGSVIYSGGLFHVFYSASDTLDNKDFENIGWATSKDGLNFTKHNANPLTSSVRKTCLSFLVPFYTETRTFAKACSGQT